MPYPSEGTLTTDIREVAIDTTWDTQTDWEAYQSVQNVVIENGVVMLEEKTIPASVTNNLDIWYPMDEGSGTTLTDALETQDATLNGGGWESNTGWGDTSPLLDGVDDYWQTDSPVSQSGVTAMTWFKPDTLSQRGGLIGFLDSRTNPQSGFEVTLVGTENRTGSVVYSGSGNVSGTGGVSGISAADEWYFVAVVVSPSSNELTTYLYDNTTPLGSNTGSGPNFAVPSSGHFIGGFESLNTAYFSGAVDAAGASVSGQLTESTIDQIWTDTQR